MPPAIWASFLNCPSTLQTADSQVNGSVWKRDGSHYEPVQDSSQLDLVYERFSECCRAVFGRESCFHQMGEVLCRTWSQTLRSCEIGRREEKKYYTQLLVLLCVSLEGAKIKRCIIFLEYCWPQFEEVGSEPPFMALAMYQNDVSN